MNKLTFKTPLLIPLFVWGISCLNYSFADDTEIYFADSSKMIKPNVMFVLDVSGSMGSYLNSNTTTNSPRLQRMTVLKDSFVDIMQDSEVKNLRVGLMSFSSSVSLQEEVVDIDEPDPELMPDISNANRDKQLSYAIRPENIAYQDKRTYDVLPVVSPTGTVAVQNAGSNSGRIIGFRYDNIILQRSDLAGFAWGDKPVKKAVLKFTVTNAVTVSRETWATITIDPSNNASFFRKDHYNDLSNRTFGHHKARCMLHAGLANRLVECDVMDTVNGVVRENGWVAGGVLVFIMELDQNAPYASILVSNSNKSLLPALDITADSRLITENKATQRNKLLRRVLNFNSSGTTAVIPAIENASKYIANKPPYQSTKPPLTEDCQLTHLVLMTDGEANISSPTAASYIRLSSANQCRIFTSDDKSTSIPDYGNSYERCGRALASWMARTSHSDYPVGNFVRTQTVGFTIKADSVAQKLLDDLAKYGMGHSYNADNAVELPKAFKDIISQAMVVTKPTASGTVSLSPESKYKQRSEMFYGLYKTASNDYWPGNVKGYKMKYDTYKLPKSGEEVKRAVLYDWQEVNTAIDSDGVFKSDLSTAWSSADSGDVTKGGVANKLGNPAYRKAYTLKSDEGVILAGQSLRSSNTNITTADLGLNSSEDARRKGLLDFIRGFTYVNGGSTVNADPKIGDSANNAVTLVSYGCDDTAADANKTVTGCTFNNLNPVAFVASNDGFFRGYDLTDGSNLYEFMPKEMLPIIDKLEKRNGVDRERAKTYGLDSTVVVYHDPSQDDVQSLPPNI